MSPPQDRGAGRPFRVIQGEGRKQEEPLASPDAVTRVLLETGVDLLLRAISPERAQEIQRRVDRVLLMFDRVDLRPELRDVLQSELDELEDVMRQTRALRRRG